MNVKHELKPVFNKDSTILILGTIPSIVSRKMGFYYMHPHNRFWKILEIIYEEKITNKEEFILKHHLALWDVLASCQINGSKDSSIKNVKVNNISKLIKETKIKAIITTGKKADELYQKYVYPQTKIKNIALPSTSSANAQYHLEDLVEEYKIIKKIQK